MNAIRRDEVTDNLHSLYVDQWDWEKVIRSEDRSPAYLRKTVETIYRVFKETEAAVADRIPGLPRLLPEAVHIVSTQELEDRYPALSPSERETEAAREYGAVFLTGIGGALRSGRRHDGRAPDYDDWSLNGDLIFYYPLLDRAFEVSSMGIRVDADALRRQLADAGCEERAALPFQRALLNGELPQTIGGGSASPGCACFSSEKPILGKCRPPFGRRAWRRSARLPAFRCCDRKDGISMRLTLYCGPLTRYYAHDWPGAPRFGRASAAFQNRIPACGWRDMACQAALDAVEPVYGRKARTVPVSPRSPGGRGGMACSSGLCTDQQRKPEPLPADWLERLETLPVFQAAQKRDACRYPTVAANCEMFLPYDADVVLTGPDPAGEEEIPIGSAAQLLRELEALNRDTWKASEAEIASWEALENGKGGRDLDCFAKRGFAALLRVARAAVSMTQPIRLDYDG